MVRMMAFAAGQVLSWRVEVARRRTNANVRYFDIKNIIKEETFFLFFREELKQGNVVNLNFCGESNAGQHHGTLGFGLEFMIS